MAPVDAIYQACRLRFRPILMTTMAAMLGGVPLALGTGTGSELRRPLGIAIIGGLIFSQMLTLYTTPVIYLFFDGLARRFSRALRTPSGRSSDRRSQAMNISEPFIRRPVATTLLLSAVALVGRRGVQPPAGFAAAAGGLSDHSGASRAAGRQPGDHGFVGGHSPRTPVRPHRRRDRNDVVEHPGIHQHHAAIRSQPRTSMPPRATCRRPSPPPAATFPPTCPTIPPIAKSTRPMRRSS